MLVSVNYNQGLRWIIYELQMQIIFFMLVCFDSLLKKKRIKAFNIFVQAKGKTTSLPNTDLQVKFTACVQLEQSDTLWVSEC